MHKYIARITLLGLLAVSATAMAQQKQNKQSYRYSWRDNHGQLHFSDSLNDVAIKNGYNVINNSGLVVRHVPRQLTPAERKAAEARQAKADAAKTAAARRHAEDVQLLEAYPTMQAYHDAQQAQIDTLTQTVQTTQINLHAQEENLAQLLAHAADLRHQGASVPAYLTKRINQQRAAVNNQRTTLARQQQAKAAAEKQMKQRIAHYRKLLAEQKAGKF